jgi:DNA polymerase
MDIVTVDFETYYDKEYSLSKKGMTTEKYIRDPRFEVIGVSVKVNGNETDWYSGENPGRFLNSMKWDDKAALAHNTAFDGAILSWCFGVRPKLWLDTLSMARPLHAGTIGVSLKALAQEYKLPAKGTEVLNALGKRRVDFTSAELDAYGEYCKNDTDITYALFHKLIRGFPKAELSAIDTTIRMFTEPKLILDAQCLTEHLDWEQKRKEKILANLGGDEAKAKKMLASNPKFADLLRALGVDPPMKVSPTTGQQTYAFAKNDKDFLALLQHDDIRVATIVEARLGTKSSIEETRTQSFLGIAERGALPIQLNYYGAHTGRFSGAGGVNPQNLTRGGKLRQAICAPPGHKLVACDLSQIEARILVCIAGQHDVVEAFRQKRDIYSEFATDVFGRPITKLDIPERFLGKTCILGLGFQTGAPKLRDTLGIGQGGVPVKIDEQEAKRIVQLYRTKNHRVVTLWDTCQKAIGYMLAGMSGEIIPGLVSYSPEGLTLPNGMMIRYPGLRIKDGQYEYIADPHMHRRDPENGWTNIYGGKMVENIVQALARIVIVGMMNKIAKLFDVVLQVHDEIIVCVPEGRVDVAVGVMEKVMSTPPNWLPNLPVACEWKVGANYGECK